MAASVVTRGSYSGVRLGAIGSNVEKKKTKAREEQVEEQLEEEVEIERNCDAYGVTSRRLCVAFGGPEGEVLALAFLVLVLGCWCYMLGGGGGGGYCKEGGGGGEVRRRRRVAHCR